MILNKKDLEIAAVGISVAAGCVPCTQFHLVEAERAKASPEQIARAVEVGVSVARSALEETGEVAEKAGNELRQYLDDHADRNTILTGIGASVARNSVSQFRSLTDKAPVFGVDDAQIMEIVGLAKRIVEKAASHLDPLINDLVADAQIAATTAALCE